MVEVVEHQDNIADRVEVVPDGEGEFARLGAGDAAEKSSDPLWSSARLEMNGSGDRRGQRQLVVVEVVEAHPYRSPRGRASGPGRQGCRLTRPCRGHNQSDRHTLEYIGDLAAGRGVDVAGAGGYPKLPGGVQI